MSSDEKSKVLTLASGRKIDLATRTVVDGGGDSVASAPSSFTPAPEKGLKLEDLQHDHKTITVVNAVLVYRSIGIPDSDICYALGCSMEQLTDVISSDAYTMIQERLHAAFVRGQESDARQLLAGHATFAAHTVINTMKNARSEKNKLVAATSLLDRVGISGRPSDMNGEGEGLVIKVVKDSNQHNGITIKIGT